MAVIYRKYRPKLFSEIAGQQHIVKTLEREIATESIAHAYLLVGPRGTGKTSIARIFARALNCQRRQTGKSEPCNECDACRQIFAERYLDVIEIDAATHTQVDNVRDSIINATTVPPLLTTGYKTFIVDEVHMLSRHAFNALLKTIEEPPPRVVFILATTEVHKVPETIASRCERFDFERLTTSVLSKRLSKIAELENITVSQDIIADIIRESHGSMRDAESLLGQLLSLSSNGKLDKDAAVVILPPHYYREAGILFEALAQKNLAQALLHIQAVIKKGASSDRFNMDIIEYLRTVLMLNVIGPNFQHSFDEVDGKHLENHAKLLAVRDIEKLLKLMIEGTRRYSNPNIPELALEIICTAFCEDAIQHNTTGSSPVADGKTNDFPRSEGSDLTVLQASWPAILDSLKGFNHSLAVFLKVGHPLTVTELNVTLGFLYDFHANTVRDSKNKPMAEKAISEILGRAITIDCVVDPNYTENHKNFNGAREAEVQDVMDVLGGGEIV